MTVPIVIKRQQEEINEIKQRLARLESIIAGKYIVNSEINVDDLIMSRPGGVMYVETKKKPGRPPKENNAKT